MPAEVQDLAIRLRAAVQRPLDTLRQLDLVPPGEVGRRTLLDVGAVLHRAIEGERTSGSSTPNLWKAVTAQATAMKALHALELIESQGVDSLREFLKRQTPLAGKRMTPAQRAFLSDPDVVEVQRRLASLTLEHPKIQKTVEIVAGELRGKPSARVIVFGQYRDTVDRLVTALESLGDPGVRPARFVGQATHGDDVGLNQREQVRILDAFRLGTVNCLVATSVAEEGLDIPATDLVVFYEPIPDVIRTIQRRGRTGRARTGRVLVLVAEGTRDEGLNRASSAREKRMHRMLEQVEADALAGRGLAPPRPKTVQQTLG